MFVKQKLKLHYSDPNLKKKIYQKSKLHFSNNRYILYNSIIRISYLYANKTEIAMKIINLCHCNQSHYCS